MDIEMNNVSRNDEGYKLNDSKKIDYKIMQINFITESIFSNSPIYLLYLHRFSV